MKPKFFVTPAAWRKWLEAHHADTGELLVGFHKKGSGKPSITWPESVDEALCFGWIDGVRRSSGEDSYTIRFTPRRARSIWSAVNIARVAELTAQSRMQAAGLEAFARRQDERSRIYAFEQKEAGFGALQEAAFRANAAAWAGFQAKPPGYRKIATWWVISAKQEQTRERRLATLMRCSELHETLPQLTRKPKSG